MKNENADIFFSYSSKDADIAMSIVEYLESKKIKCFIAPRDIPLGSDFAETLITAIEHSRLVIVVLTENSNNSNHVRNEIDRAFHNKKPIILFRIENIKLSKSLEFYVSTYQWLDAFQFKPEIYYEQLYCFIQGLPIPPLPKHLLLSKRILLNSLLIYLIVSLGAFVFWGIPILKEHSIVSKKTSRNTRLIDAFINSGLTDIETRKVFTLPPVQLYENAKYEIFVSGITLHNTLESHREYFKNALKRGVKIKFLLLDPKSKDSIIIDTNKNQPWSSSIMGSIAIIKKDTALFKNSNIDIRFSPDIPSITGIMIDGDLSPGTNTINDSFGVIRAVIYFKSPKHEDWVFQFNKRANKATAFDDFATEFRTIWKSGKSHPELFE